MVQNGNKWSKLSENGENVHTKKGVDKDSSHLMQASFMNKAI